MSGLNLYDFASEESVFDFSKEQYIEERNEEMGMSNSPQSTKNSMMEKSPQGDRVFLGPNTQNKKTLILDLDNTLICTLPVMEMREGNENPCVRYEISIRPYAIELIERASSLFEIIVFTAAEEEYAEMVVKLLDPQRIYISRHLSISSCSHSKDGVLIKDLSIIADREIKNLIIVDDCISNYNLQPDNGVPVSPYFGEEEDEELRYLIDYLEEMALEDDIVKFNKKRMETSYNQ